MSAAGAFARTEHEQRLARARCALRDAGLAGAVCVAPETIYYLCGYEGYTFWTEQALVLSADREEPVLILRDTDLPLADETVAIGALRSYRLGRHDPVDLCRDALIDLGLGGGTVGTEKSSYALPASYWDRLVARCGDSVQLTDCSRLLSRLRVHKSAAEISYVQAAAAIARAGTAAAIEGIRAGVDEIHVAAAIERGLREAGTDYSAMPTMVASGPRTTAVHATPTNRVVGDGEPVVVWYAGVSRRYHVTAYRTVHVGQPSRRFRELYLAAEDALGVLVENVALGQPVSRAAGAAAAELRGGGYEDYHIARWGYGVGIAYPPVWLEAFDVVEESDDVFQSGTLMCLHVCFSSRGDEVGLYVGGDYLLTDSGLENLDEVGPELIVV